MARCPGRGRSWTASHTPVRTRFSTSSPVARSRNRLLSQALQVARMPAARRSLVARSQVRAASPVTNGSTSSTVKKV